VKEFALVVGFRKASAGWGTANLQLATQGTTKLTRRRTNVCIINVIPFKISHLVYCFVPMRLLTDQCLSPRCGLCERASAIGVQDLLVEEDTAWTSQQEYSRSHVGVSARATSRVAHAGLDTALVVFVGSASGHLHRVSSTFTNVLFECQSYIPHLGKLQAQWC